MNKLDQIKQSLPELKERLNEVSTIATRKADNRAAKREINKIVDSIKAIESLVNLDLDVQYAHTLKNIPILFKNINFIKDELELQHDKQSVAYKESMNQLKELLKQEEEEKKKWFEKHVTVMGDDPKKNEIVKNIIIDGM